MQAVPWEQQGYLGPLPALSLLSGPCSNRCIELEQTAGLKHTALFQLGMNLVLETSRRTPSLHIHLVPFFKNGCLLIH